VTFRGNDFSAMQFSEVEFRGGIDLRKQRLPTGPLDLYIKDPARSLERARRALSAWDDHDRREDALLSIDILQRELDIHNQKQLYVHVPDLEGDPQTQRALAEALGPSERPVAPGCLRIVRWGWWGGRRSPRRAIRKTPDS
jgi:hypothetical protein